MPLLSSRTISSDRGSSASVPRGQRCILEWDSGTMVAIQKQLVQPGSKTLFKREVEPRIRIRGYDLSTVLDDFSR